MHATGCLALLSCLAGAADEGLGTSGFADSGGVKIHYVTKGEGPLLVLLHGFPDYHYTWRGQIPALAKHFQVVAVDLRGYNRSGQPKKVEDYAMEKLVGDVEAVIKHFKKDKAVVVGHDWGGAIAWNFAAARPKLTDRLVVLNCPHPAGILRELANNPEQRKNSAYARAFQEKDAAKVVKPELLLTWVKDKKDRKKYEEALGRSSLEGMLAYYKMNYPRPPYKADAVKLAPVKCPTLVVHGLGDVYLLPGALNDTWKWVEGELTVVTVPKAGHWVHHDAEALVNKRLLGWLTAK